MAIDTFLELNELELRDARLKVQELSELEAARERLPELEAAAEERARRAKMQEDADRAARDLEMLLAKYGDVLAASNRELSSLIAQLRRVAEGRRDVAALAQRMMRLARVVALPALDTQPGITEHTSPSARADALTSLAQQVLIDAGVWPLLLYDGDASSPEAQAVRAAVCRLLPGGVVTKSSL